MREMWPIQAIEFGSGMKGLRDRVVKHTDLNLLIQVNNLQVSEILQSRFVAIALADLLCTLCSHRRRSQQTHRFSRFASNAGIDGSPRAGGALNVSQVQFYEVAFFSRFFYQLRDALS